MRKLALTFAIAAFALAIGPPAVAATPSYDCVASARSDTTTPNLVAVQATDAAIAVDPNANREPPHVYYAALVFAGSGAMYDHTSHVDLSSPTIDYS
jgi:hypothetical protein